MYPTAVTLIDEPVFVQLPRVIPVLRAMLVPLIRVKFPQGFAVAATPFTMFAQSDGLIVTDVPLAPVCRRARKVSLFRVAAAPFVMASKVFEVEFHRTFESAPVLMTRVEGLQPVSGATVS